MKNEKEGFDPVQTDIFELIANPTMFAQVKAFHEKFGLQYNSGARELDPEELEFRIKCHREELQEFEDAVTLLNALLAPKLDVEQFNQISLHSDGLNNELLEALNSDALDKNHPKVLDARQEVFDALLDGTYFYLGTCHRMGFDADKGFMRVNEANMAKELPKQGTKTKRDWHMEVIKPEGWQPPNLIDLVTCQEWPDNNVNKVRGLITLDGPDCSGKTTLAEHLVAAYGGEYIHLTWSPELEAVMDRYRISAIEYAIALSTTKLVVLDRPWISQVIYAEVYRGGTKWPNLIEHCDQLLQEANAVQILCLPETVEQGVELFANSGKAHGEELYDDITKTIVAFKAVYEGDIQAFNPTSSEYLSAIMRNGGVRARKDTLVYSIGIHGDHISEFSTVAIGHLDFIKLS